MSSSSSKPSAIAHNYSDAIDRVMLRPFDDTRGKNNDGGWWISLEEAKKKYGIWWTETTEMSDEKNAVSSVPIPDIKYPIWVYKDKSMYLGSWREIRMGSGGGTRRHEHGDGIQCKRNGQCFVGQFENGSYHGWGRSFWLKNSKEWKENSLTLDVDSKGEEETVIKEPRMLAANGEQKDTFLPFEYYGKFYNNKKHCTTGVVTLKDGTKKVGRWAHNIAVMPVCFQRCDPSVTIAKDGVDWWTNHHDYASVQLDISSPASRSLKRASSNSSSKDMNIQQQQQQNLPSLPLATSTSCSTAAVADAILIKKNPPMTQSERKRKSRLNPDVKQREREYKRNRNRNGTDAEEKNVDQRRNEGSSKRTKVNHPPKIGLPRGTSDTTNNNEDKKIKKKKEEKNSVDVAGHDGGREERLKHQPHQDDQDDDDNDNNNNNSDTSVIDVDAVVPDDAPSSASASARVSSSSSSSSPSSSLTVTKSYIYPDAILLEKEELDLPLHAAVKFGDEECLLEELEKIKERSKSSNGSSNGNGNGNERVIDINTVDSKRRTALDLAALTGQLDIVKKLRGVPGSKFCFMSVPRMKLIANSRSKDVEKYLKEVKEMVE